MINKIWPTNSTVSNIYTDNKTSNFTFGTVPTKRNFTRNLWSCFQKVGTLGNIPSAETRVLMGLDDELYLQKIEMEKKQKQRTSSTPRPPAAPPQTYQRIQAYRTCPNCCTQISPPLASGRQMCRKCGWLGSAVKTVVAAPKPSPPVRDSGWEAIAWLTTPFRQMRFLTHNTLWVRYALVLGLTTVVPVFLHFNEQARRGHPLDIHFFEAELSPFHSHFRRNISCRYTLLPLVPSRIQREGCFMKEFS
jgi:hypothetical protein